jgi:hypothetical protein
MVRLRSKAAAVHLPKPCPRGVIVCLAWLAGGLAFDAVPFVRGAAWSLFAAACSTQ